jgi:hypothetical protein
MRTIKYNSYVKSDVEMKTRNQASRLGACWWADLGSILNVREMNALSPSFIVWIRYSLAIPSVFSNFWATTGLFLVVIEVLSKAWNSTWTRGLPHLLDCEWLSYILTRMVPGLRIETTIHRFRSMNSLYDATHESNPYSRFQVHGSYSDASVCPIC